MDLTKSDRLRQVSSDPAPFGKEQLDVIRKDAGLINHLVSAGNWIETRMAAELIAAIPQLDETSTELINTTNKLTAVNLGVAIVVGVAMFLGLGITALEFFAR